nr:hypothetical protein OG461_26555 [Streptomyces sp. NBC_00995]
MIFSNDPDPVAAPAPAPASSSAPVKPSALPSPDHAWSESEPPTATPGDTASASPSPSPDVDLAAPAGYAEATETMWGLAPGSCEHYEQQIVDLDDGTSRVESGEGVVKDPRGAELLYWPSESCIGHFGDYQLRALPNTRVGLLRADMPKTFESCKAASGTGFGGLQLADGSESEARGFVEGAAVCSVTDKGAVSMALIEHTDGGTFDDVSVSGRLYVWPKAP